jgi:hypothetical protein
MKYSDKFSKTGFLPNRTFLWNISISADSIEGALKAVEELGKAIRKRRISFQKIEADYWLELDKLRLPAPNGLSISTRKMAPGKTKVNRIDSFA